MDDLTLISQQLRGTVPEVQAALNALLTRWQARAIGLWSFNDQFLHLLGFAAVNDMPSEVSNGFQDATRKVSLTQDKLGIVNAVLRQEPVPAYLDHELSSLRDSASWIEKFGCKSSLSVPIFEGAIITNVLAVSYKTIIQPPDQSWKEQVQVARLLTICRPST